MLISDDIPLTRMSSTPTRDVLARAESTHIDEIPVSVVCRADLIQAKREANRPKDRIDLLELEGE